VLYYEEAEDAVQIVFDGYALFFQRKAAVPSLDDVVASMAEANYNQYLKEFVWHFSDGDWSNGIVEWTYLGNYDRLSLQPTGAPTHTPTERDDEFAPDPNDDAVG
jgi:hypothetical protein